MSTLPTHYLGISTGPVVDTILSARKTRELWTASYLFSTLMRELVRAALNNGLEVWSPTSPGVYTAQSTSLAPAAAPPEVPSSSLFGAGIYHDRLYAAYTAPGGGSPEELQTKFVAIRDEAIKATTDQLAGGAAFFKDFFRIAHVWLPQGNASANLLGDLNGLLDTQELFPALLSPDNLKQNALVDLLEKPYRATMVQRGLAANAQNTYNEISAAHTRSGVRLPFDFFPSTAQIASVDLYHKNDAAYQALQTDIVGTSEFKAPESQEDLTDGSTDDPLSDNAVLQEFYRRLDNKEVPAFRDHFQDFHKYFCIVHADGDHFGQVIEGLGNDRLAIERFSGQLANFAAAAATVINDHGGRAIYIGGDDLLFFAPVAYGTKTVFDLINAIDDTFKEACSFTPQPSLSYGVTLSHYKYPLFEAKSDSYAALERAKSFKWKRGETKGAKDAIAFRFIRHSGSFFTGVMDKPLLQKFLEVRMLRTEQDFLSSFTFKLQELEPLIDALGASLTEERLQNIINNFFDEPIHGQNRAALNKLIELYTCINELSGSLDDPDFAPRRNTYAILRLMTFTLPKTTPAHVLA